MDQALAPDGALRAIEEARTGLAEGGRADRAIEVCTTGKRYSAEEALTMGMIGYCVEDDLLGETTDKLVKEITSRLGFLINVGLDYLTLSRKGPTLSGGEAQRIRLASQVGSELIGVLYILDEPTTGLHFLDIRMLLTVLQRLVASGNTVIIIEHNLDVIKTADWVIDLGPEGGSAGGRIVAEGTPEAVAKVRKSYTGRYLNELLPGDLKHPHR